MSRGTGQRGATTGKTMYAVIRTGGKQYKVAPDDVIRIERLAAAEPGADIELGEVLMMGDGAAVTLGTPTVAGARVAATVLGQVKGDKVIIFKKKRRQGYHRTRGHRQNLTVLRITEILAAGAERTAKPATAAPAEEAAEETAAPAPKRRTSARMAAPKAAKAAGEKKPAAKRAAPRAKKPAKPKEKR
jgi:large subunit ribosomal protein L21